MNVSIKAHSDFNLMTLTTDLVNALKGEGLKIKNVKRCDLPEPLKTTICSFTIGNYIFVILDDFVGRYTIRELEVILWHEYAHRYLNTLNEEVCDTFAIAKVGKEVYDSAVKKSAELTSELRQLYGINNRDIHKYDHRNAVL